MDTYVSAPSSLTANGNILLFFADAFGLCAKNFLIMDAFAARGYLVLGVDYFMGVRMEVLTVKNSQLIWRIQDAVSKHTMTPLTDPNFDLKAWSQKHLESSEVITEKWVAEVQSQYGSTGGVKFACVGYW